MHQYFEHMALALRTLKSDNFAFGVCSLKHDVISCSDFSHKLQLISVAIRVRNHILSMFLVFKLSQFVLGGTYVLCCVEMVCLVGERIGFVGTPDITIIIQNNSTEAVSVLPGQDLCLLRYA